MIPLLQVVSVSEDFKSICLFGDGKKKYLSFGNSKIYRIGSEDELLIRFSSEMEGVIFVQSLIDDGVPFLDAERTYAYSDVMDFIRDGRLHGNPVRSTWKDGKYTIHD